MGQTIIKRIENAGTSLRTRKLKGCVITCPQCQQKGIFGSITKIRETPTSLEHYIICGWCNKSTLVNIKTNEVKTIC